MGLVVFAPLAAMQSIYAPVGLIFETQCRTDLRFGWMICASVCYVLSFVVGLHWGFMGVAVSYSIVWTLLMVPSFMVPFRLIELSGWDFLRTLWPTIWISLIMSSCAIAWRLRTQRLGMTNPVLDLSSSAMVGALVYIALMIWHRPPVLSELIGVLAETSNPWMRRIGRLLNGESNRRARLSSLYPAAPAGCD